MLIQIHMLQNYAPSNLNRDQNGAPKDTIFGGVRRGRISSQSLKRSIRTSSIFKDSFAGTNLLGIRTKQLAMLLRKEFEALNVESGDIDNILSRLEDIIRGGKNEKGKKPKGKSSKKNGQDIELADAVQNDGEGEAESAAAASGEILQLVFVGRDELPVLAQKMLAAYQKFGKDWIRTDADDNNKGDIAGELGSSAPLSVDIALFGRMTTSNVFTDVEGSLQAAHAISTHAINKDFDFFTAIDDLSGSTGAGMIGDVQFNSSTYYKYYCIHWEKLVENLGGDVEVAAKTVLAFLNAAVQAHPSGKQNAFAAHNLPDLVLVEVSEKNLPLAYSNAFLSPVKASESATLLQASTSRLNDYRGKIEKAYDLIRNAAYLSVDGGELSAERVESLSALRKWLEGQLPS